jgi:DNA-binding transcriptional ArsR family regulator
MPHPSVPADVFGAVAEPQRRQILGLLAGGERSVNDLAGQLGLRQPQTSKQLRVLREAGLVRVRGVGQQRLYQLNGEALLPIFDWVQGFEASWNGRLDRLDGYLARLQKEPHESGQ